MCINIEMFVVVAGKLSIACSYAKYFWDYEITVDDIFSRENVHVSMSMISHWMFSVIN